MVNVWDVPNFPIADDTPDPERVNKIGGGAKFAALYLAKGGGYPLFPPSCEIQEFQRVEQ